LPWIAGCFGGKMSFSLASLAVFYLAGAAIILLARLRYLSRDR
jgi:hypothetical protein